MFHQQPKRRVLVLTTQSPHSTRAGSSSGGMVIIGVQPHDNHVPNHVSPSTSMTLVVTARMISSLLQSSDIWESAQQYMG